MNPIFLADFYKFGHINQYPAGITQVWSNWTPRTSRVPDTDVVIHFGLTYFLKEYLQQQFQDNFFRVSFPIIKFEYEQVIRATLGIANPRTDHIEALWKLGYLPITIYSLPEGTGVPLNTPPGDYHQQSSGILLAAKLLRDVAVLHVMEAMHQRHHCTTLPQDLPAIRPRGRRNRFRIRGLAGP